MKSISAGVRLIACQLIPPSSSSGRPALAGPAYCTSSAVFSASCCSPVSRSAVSRSPLNTNAPLGRAALSSSALFQAPLALCTSTAKAAASSGASP